MKAQNHSRPPGQDSPLGLNPTQRRAELRDGGGPFLTTQVSPRVQPSWKPVLLLHVIVTWANRFAFWLKLVWSFIFLSLFIQRGLILVHDHKSFKKHEARWFLNSPPNILKKLPFQDLTTKNVMRPGIACQASELFLTVTNSPLTSGRPFTPSSRSVLLSFCSTPGTEDWDGWRMTRVVMAGDSDQMTLEQSQVKVGEEVMWVSGGWVFQSGKTASAKVLRQTWACWVQGAWCGGEGQGSGVVQGEFREEMWERADCVGSWVLFLNISMMFRVTCILFLVPHIFL